MIEIGRILIVDDSAMMRMVLRKSLGMAKVHAQEIIEVSNGHEALQSMQQSRFDIVFCDLNMPGMNGDEMLEHIATLENFNAPPIVIVSSEATPHRLDQLNKSQIVGVLRKPFTPELIAKFVSESQCTCFKGVS